MNILIKRLLIFSTIIFIPLIKADLDLLDTPTINSKLATKSILNDMIKYNNSFLAVGVRSHIINWQSPEQWQQEQAPVSVALTAISVLPDGTKVAVGHDSAIIICAAGSNQWQKVFDGFGLL
ncbi:MAG: sialidase, partial [Gammaproteobacteria bacterium]|nr:sialidase [Gammaproteobacteria bacterium]